ncbi:MAG: RNA polymerase sigma factor [Gemmataceae bacterium]|nr:RNA polymerase sigma factor [Gemmataceae bacterium]MDW8242194.1 RNA polymerase sigma factor [Thermogemmata sp.]
MSSEGQLIYRCLRGDPAACGELVSCYQGIVYRLCRRLLGCPHDAEDVTQEVFLRVFRSLHRWDGRRPFRPWLVGIAVNRCRTWLRRRVHQPQLADFLAERADPRPQDETRELQTVLQQTLSRLRAEYRQVFLLFHEQGQTYEQIALTLQRPVGTIKTWLHRARLEVLDYLRASGLVDTNTPAHGMLPAEGQP